jgi:hypothetical protein
MHMPRSDARFYHFPTTAWPFSSHNDTRISHLERKHNGIIERLGQLETKIDTLCNETADPSGTTNSDSPSKETDTEGGNTEKESPGDSNNAVDLHHEIQKLKTESNKMNSAIETLRKEDAAAHEDLRIQQSQRMKERLDARTEFNSSVDHKEDKYNLLIGNAPAASRTSKVIVLPNSAQSRYAVRIPR